MDPPVGEKRTQGDAGTFSESIKKLPEDFRGTVRMVLDNGNGVSEYELILESSFIISASVNDRKTGSSQYGDEAIKEIKEKLANPKGDFEIYSCSEQQFKDIVNRNPAALIELVVNAGKLQDITQAEEPKVDSSQGGDGNPDDLEKDWQHLQEEWKKYDIKQKQYLDKLVSKENISCVAEISKENKTSSTALHLESEAEERIEKKLAKYSVGNNAESQAVQVDILPDQVSDDMIMGDLRSESKQKKIDIPKPVIQEATPVTKAVSEKESDTKLPASRPEEFLSKTTQEIENLKKKVDVYWGWDKKKKMFVGMDHPPEQEEAKKAPEPVPAVVAQSAQPEIKVEAAPVPTPQPFDITLPLVARKKIGMMDRVKLMKYPPSLKLLEKINGKKTLDQLALEIKITPQEAVKAVDLLKKEGFV